MADSLHLEVLLRLFAAAPDHPPLQRAVAAAADLARSAERTSALKTLAATPALVPALREQLATDRTDAVRAAVWARDDWDTAALAAALDRDFSAPTRRAVIRNPACTTELLVRAASPLLKSLADAILERPDIAPADLLLTTLDVAFTAPTSALTDSADKRLTGATRAPGVAEVLVRAENTPVALRLLALGAEHLSEADFLAGLALLPKERPVPSGELGREYLRLLDRTVTKTTPRPLPVVETVADLYQHWGGSTKTYGNISEALTWAARDEGQRLTQRFNRCDTAGSLMKLVSSVPPGGFPRQLAQQIAQHRLATVPILEKLLPSLGDDTFDGYLTRITRQPDGEHPRRWMVDYPEVFLAFAEQCRLRNFTAACASLANQTPGLADRLAGHLCAHPDRFHPAALVTLLGLLDVDADALTGAPWSLLCAALVGDDLEPARRRTLTSALLTELDALDTLDRDTAVQRARAMEALASSPAPVRDVVRATLATETTAG